MVFFLKRKPLLSLTPDSLLFLPPTNREEQATRQSLGEPGNWVITVVSAQPTLRTQASMSDRLLKCVSLF